VTGGRKLARHDFCAGFGDGRAPRHFATMTLKRNGVESSFRFSLLLRMIFSENRQPPRIKSGASFFGILQ